MLSNLRAVKLPEDFCSKLFDLLVGAEQALCYSNDALSAVRDGVHDFHDSVLVLKVAIHVLEYLECLLVTDFLAQP